MADPVTYQPSVSQPLRDTKQGAPVGEMKSRESVPHAPKPDGSKLGEVRLGDVSARLLFEHRVENSRQDRSTTRLTDIDKRSTGRTNKGVTTAAPDRPRWYRTLLTSFLASIGRLGIQREQIAHCQLQMKDPVVQGFFKGQLSNRCASQVLDRIRDRAVHGSDQERIDALNLLRAASRQYDGDKRTSFYDSYYRRCAGEVLGEFKRYPERRLELSEKLTVADRWIMLQADPKLHSRLQDLCGEDISQVNMVFHSTVETLLYDQIKPLAKRQSAREEGKVIDERMIRAFGGSLEEDAAFSDQPLATLLDGLELPRDRMKLVHGLNRINRDLCLGDPQAAEAAAKAFEIIRKDDRAASILALYCKERTAAYTALLQDRMVKRDIRLELCQPMLAVEMQRRGGTGNNSALRLLAVLEGHIEKDGLAHVEQALVMAGFKLDDKQSLKL